jgi:adenosylcobinamide-GDP ribazoletransferase
MRRELQLFLLALQFFTRVPVVGPLARLASYSEDALTASTRYFPLIGALVAAVQILLFWLLQPWLPEAVVIMLVISAGIWLTGAFHEDGWADFCDAFGGHHDRENTLRIMTDSRIGSYGAIGLVILLLLKFQLLLSVQVWLLPTALLVAHTFSRVMAVLVMRVLPYAKPQDNSKTKPLAIGLKAVDAWLAWAFGLTIAGAALILVPAKDLGQALVACALAIALGVAGCLYMIRLMKKRLQGYTGDGLGATQQLCELLTLLGFVFYWPKALSV